MEHGNHNTPFLFRIFPWSRRKCLFLNISLLLQDVHFPVSIYINTCQFLSLSDFLQIRHKGRVAGGICWAASMGGRPESFQQKESLWAIGNSYRFAGMEIETRRVESMRNLERKNFSWLSDWIAFYTPGGGGGNRGAYQGARIFSLRNFLIQRCILSRGFSRRSRRMSVYSSRSKTAKYFSA